MDNLTLLTNSGKRGARDPPVASGGNLLSGGIERLRGDPISYWKETREKYGEIFTVHSLFGLMKFTVVMGQEGMKKVLNAPDDKLNFMKGLGKSLEPSMGDDKETPKELEDVFHRITKGIQRSQKYNLNHIRDINSELLQNYSDKECMDVVDFVENIIYRFFSREIYPEKKN